MRKIPNNGYSYNDYFNPGYYLVVNNELGIPFTIHIISSDHEGIRWSFLNNDGEPGHYKLAERRKFNVLAGESEEIYQLTDEEAALYLVTGLVPNPNGERIGD